MELMENNVVEYELFQKVNNLKCTNNTVYTGWPINNVPNFA